MLLALLSLPLLASVSPCKPDSPEHAEARTALRRVERAVEALAPGADPAAVWKEIRALPKLVCLAGADEEMSRFEAPDSGLALQSWWEAGGGSWLDHYLRFDSTPRRAVIAPDMRRSLTLERAPGSPLAPLLCAAGDTTCGAETRGWAKRAADAFRLHAFENGRARHPEHGDRRGPACAPEPASTPPVDRWRRWRDCVRNDLDTTAALPLGRFRAPAEGWLVVRGRRGHYAFCDEVRVYDLATGAAWIAQSCGGLALRDDGSVDGRATDASRRPRARAGRVPLDPLREAAWMILLSPEVQADVQPWAHWVDVPAGLEPAWPDPESSLTVSGTIGLGFWSSSAQTRLSASWKRKGAAPVERALTWPDSSDAGEHHAVRLLDIAESGFIEGCPPAELPPTVAAKTAAPAVGSLDAPGGVAKTQDGLVQALLDLPPCP